MEITTLIGFVMGIGAVLLGQVLEGGHIGALMELTAGIIVLGGTVGATILSFTLADLKMGVKYFFTIFFAPKEDPQYFLMTLVKLASIARKEGLLALEDKTADESNIFLKSAIQYTVDGYEAKVICDILEKQIETMEEEMTTAAKIFEALGGYAPTVGILGAVLGLIHVMEVMADPSQIGKGIAVAFVATVYGVGLANLVFLPISSKIKRKLKVELLNKELILKGAICLQEGLSPRVLEDQLNAFLEEKLRKSSFEV
jgi:chemotaxis protein MotA